MPASRVSQFHLPLRSPLETAAGRLRTRTGALFEIVDGPGLGEATPLQGWTESLTATIVALSGAVRECERSGWRSALAHTTGLPAARHAVALARCDRAARRAGVSLASHLARGSVPESVPVNVTIGDVEPEQLGPRIEAAVEAGYGAIKLKVGARSLETDLRRVRIARDRAGESVELRVDANGAWPPTVARRALQGLADLGVSVAEQPVARDDVDALKGLRGGPVAVAADETLSWRGPGVDAVLAADAADLLVIKPMVLGGPDRAMAIARRAERAGLEWILTTTVDAAVARTTAVHVAAALDPSRPCGLATAGHLARDLAADPAPVEDGRVRVPTSIGHGVDVGRGDR